MSTFDYIKATATASRLIKRFGQSITLRQQAGSGTAWAPVLTDTDHVAIAAVTEYSNRDMDGTLIKMGDRRVYLSTEGLTVVPTTQDKLVVGGEVMTIVNIRPLNPAGVTVMYEVQARA